MDSPGKGHEKRRSIRKRGKRTSKKRSPQKRKRSPSPRSEDFLPTAKMEELDLNDPKWGLTDIDNPKPLKPEKNYCEEMDTQRKKVLIFVD